MRIQMSMMMMNMMLKQERCKIKSRDLAWTLSPNPQT